MYRKLNRLNHGYVCYSHQPKYTFFVRVFKYYVMTQWNSLLLNSKGNALLQKATFHHLVTKFSAFYATRRLITAFTQHRHLSLSSTKLIQSLPSHPIYFTFNIIVTSTPRSFKSSSSFTFPHKTPDYAFVFSPIHATCPSHFIVLDLITRIIFGHPSINKTQNK